jgi:hypothetical protein
MDEPPPQPTEQSPPPPPSNHTGSPTDFLKNVVGKRVIVRLLSGVDYRGMVTSFRPIGFPYGYAYRSLVMPGWLHEHRIRTNGGAR